MISSSNSLCFKISQQFDGICNLKWPHKRTESTLQDFSTLFYSFTITRRSLHQFTLRRIHLWNMMHFWYSKRSWLVQHIATDVISSIIQTYRTSQLYLPTVKCFFESPLLNTTTTTKMSQIENSRICSITRSSSVNANQGNAENHPTDSPNPFLKSPLRSIYHFKTTSEKRNTFALQSKKASSDGRVACSAQSDEGLPSGAFAHSRNKSTFEFWQHLHQRGNEQNLNEELSRVIPANSPQAVEHLQSAISNVNLEVGTPSDNNNGMLTHSQLEMVAQKVESVHCESGEEVSNVEASLPGTRDSLSAATDASGIEEETAASLQVLSASKQESQNLRPILKRKEAPVWSIPQALVPSLRPPILKKRDSLSECHVSDCQSTVNNVQTGNKPFPYMHDLPKQPPPPPLRHI